MFAGLTVGKSYDIANFLGCSKLSHVHRAYTLSVSSHEEPTYFHQAVNSPLWRQVMVAEIFALETKNTWTLTSLPPNKTAIGCG